MKRVIEILEENVLSQICRDIMSGNSDDVKRILLESYNRYQEDERDGVDYIFNGLNPEDISFLAYDRKMSVEHLADVTFNSLFGDKPYFFYGCNHPEPKFLSELEFHTQIVSYVSEYLPYVLAYPHIYDEFYKRFVTPCLIDCL